VRIGVTRRNYVAQNVVQGAVHPEIEFRRVPHLPLRRVARRPFWRHATVALAGGGIDLVHLYNEVGLCSRPWVTTFEDEVPVGRRRSPRAWAAGLRQAAGPRCRAVLAMSHHARRRLAADPEAGPALLGKCRVVWPCVPRGDAHYARRLDRLRSAAARGGPLEVLFVGVQFFRKGGEFVLDALEPLAARGDPGVRLTIVSSFEPDGYVTPTDPARVALARRRVAALPWVRHVETLDPSGVRALMAESDLLAFPTLDETFGFVLAEALATGLPVATTRTRAIPEILPAEELEAVIDLTAGPDGSWEGVRLWRTAGEPAYARAWGAARERAIEGLRRRVATVLEERPRARERAEARRAHYLERFSPEALGARLAEVYRRALA
jgi:glycosyltransferase involved in cell wall biosynthesis